MRIAVIRHWLRGISHGHLFCRERHEARAWTLIVKRSTALARAKFPFMNRGLANSSAATFNRNGYTSRPMRQPR